MKVLVTGANGLLGHHVVFELLKQQYSVRIIIRSTKNIHFDLNKIEVFEGNFTDYEIMKQAAAGCDAIIHIAAVTATNLLHYEDYRKINVEGSALVIKVANELNINRIVYVSSANTIGFGTEQQLADECFNIKFPFSESFYAQSKVTSEQLFIEASTELNKHMVIINPTFMIGAFDTKPSSGKLLLMGYKKWLMFIPKGGKNFVAAKDVAVSVCNALVQGRNGERYLASGINLSFKEFYALQMQIENYRQHIFELPNFTLILVAKVGDLLRKLGLKTELCSMNLRQLMIREYYSNKKAKNELNFSETDITIAIKEAIDWFKNHKMI
jgi:dihydroflavonol-4-reductase